MEDNNQAAAPAASLQQRVFDRFRNGSALVRIVCHVRFRFRCLFVSHFPRSCVKNFMRRKENKIGSISVNPLIIKRKLHPAASATKAERAAVPRGSSIPRVATASSAVPSDWGHLHQSGFFFRSWATLEPWQRRLRRPDQIAGARIFRSVFSDHNRLTFTQKPSSR